MAVPITSRYRSLGIQEAPDAAGVQHPAVPILRHSPSAIDPRQTQYRHRITGTEGIEYLAFRFYGNSESWWRIADANPVQFPLDVRPGDAVAVPSGDEAARTEDRSRNFA